MKQKRHLDYNFSQSVNTLGVIRIMTLFFSIFYSLLLLYLTLVRYKIKHTPVICNSVTSAVAKNLEHIQRRIRSPVSKSLSLPWTCQSLGFTWVFKDIKPCDRRRQSIRGLFNFNILSIILRCYMFPKPYS
jgi:hypothetical protein